MRQMISLLAFAVLAAAPAMAAEPDPHQAHHPAASATQPAPPSAAQPSGSPAGHPGSDHCPMMSGQEGTQNMAMGDGPKMHGHDMHCMHMDQAPAKPAEPHADHHDG